MVNSDINHRLDHDLRQIRNHLDSGSLLHAYQLLMRYEDLLLENRKVVQLYAECLAKQGRNKEAADIYAKYLTQNPADYSVILSLGKMYFLQKEWTKAAEVWKKLPFKKYQEIRYLIGYTLYRAGKIKSAASYLESYINKTAAPIGHPAAYFYLAKFYCKSRNYESALPLIEDLLAYYPDEPIIYRLAALIYYKNEMAEHGAEMVQLALEANPEPGKFINIAVPVLLYSGKVKQAMELMEKTPGFLEDDSTKRSRRRRLWYADALFLHKKYAKSRIEFQRLLALSPGNRYITRKLQLIEEKY